MENAIRLTCLVLEPVALVAEDLVAIIEDTLPGTPVFVAPTAEVALESLRERRIDIAFVNLSPLELARSGLVERLDEIGATLVVLGHEVAAKGVRHRVLELPFVSGAVALELMTALRRLRRRRTTPEGLGRA